ncbi:hypothetical protein P7L75_23140 [Tistrella mobilis]|uniref:hypothetical protein n=1 Tax=Tistrella mobilis TaxID=171437 RepID=UPI003558F9C0
MAPFKLANILHVTQCLSTNPRLPIILIKMKRFTRILALTLLAVFAAGTVAHAAGATTMAVKMALAAAGAMDMGDCEGCGSGGDDGKSGATCDIICISPFAGTLNVEGSFLLPIATAPSAFGRYDFVGCTGPPDPYPPRPSS